MNYLTLSFGLLILIKGADLFVGASSKIAKRFQVPALLIGIFIMAIGTSAPEAAIGILSGIQGNNLITLGDVLGSCIINITVILGITALVHSLKVDDTVPGREIMILIVVQVGLILMLYTGFILSRMESVVLLAGMILFLGYLYVNSNIGFKKGKMASEFQSEVLEYVEKQEEVRYDEIPEEAAEDVSNLEILKPGADLISEPMAKLVILFLVGLAGLIAGANMAVDSALKIAHLLGLNEAFIGITIVAFGTSLPEFVTSLVAVYKKEEEIAVGNIIGSNIFNILFVLGMSGLIHPIAVTSDVFFDLFAMLGASILLLVPTKLYNEISKKTGFVYLAVYLVYLSLKLNRLG